MTQIPARGWYVEIDDPESGHTWSPDVVDDPQINPGANDFPRLSVPVRKRERWLDSRYEGAEMRVWKDGKRLPIEEFDKPIETEQGMTIEGRGGVELDKRLQKEVEQKEAHLVAEDIIQNNTPYTANVDDPNAAQRANVLQQEADSSSELSNNLQPIPSTKPLTIQNGKLVPLQAAYHIEAEDLLLSGTGTDSTSSEGEYETLTGQQQDTAFVSLDYTIPANRVSLGLRLRNPNDPDSDGDYEGHGFELIVDGETIATFTDDWLGSETYIWQSLSGLSSDLSGSVSVEIDATGKSGAQTDFDLIVLYDNKYNFSFPDTVDGDLHLSGPELKPDRVEIETLDATTPWQFTGGKFSASFDDTSNDQRVGVSNDSGSSYTYVDNGETVETDFNNSSVTLRGKIGLSRYGTRTSETPTTGFNGQEVDLYELFGDIDETPLLINQDYDKPIIEALQDIAEYADFIFEFRLEDGSPSIEMTTPGQRVSSGEPNPTGYRYEKSVEEQVGEVVIKSGRVMVRQETFTADYGTAVDLNNGNVTRGTEVVYDSSTGTEFEEGVDYRLSPGTESDTASITTLSTGSMTDGDSYAIDYAYQEVGEFVDPNAPADPDTLTQTLPSLTTQRACDQAAAVLGRQLDEPLEKATVTLPTSDVGFNIVEAQQFAALPTDTQWEIREITTKADSTQFRLGSRESISELVGRLQRRLSAAAQRT